MLVEAVGRSFDSSCSSLVVRTVAVGKMLVVRSVCVGRSLVLFSAEISRSLVVSVVGVGSWLGVLAGERAARVTGAYDLPGASQNLGEKKKSYRVQTAGEMSVAYRTWN